MIRTLTAIALAISLARAGSAQSVDKAKIRQAIKLPEISINSSVSFRFGTDLGAPEDPAAHIEALQKTLTGAPSDAAIYVKIGDASDKNRGQAAYRKAIALFRTQLEKQPQNGELMAQLGAALFHSRQYAEADKVLREAVRVAPNDWHAWAELGKSIQDHLLILMMANNKRADSSFNDIVSDPQGAASGLSKEELTQQITLLQITTTEAHADFDHAVALSPDSPGAYEARAGFYFADRMFVQNAIKVAQGEAPDYTMVVSPEMLTDIRKMADLAPNDTAIQANAAMCELVNYMATAENGTPGLTGNIDRMPAASRDRVRAALAQLQKALDSKDPRDSKIAASTLAGLYLFNGEMDKAEPMAKRTLALEPTNTHAWETMCAVYVAGKRFKEFAAALEERIKHEDTPYNRLMLAKTYDHLPDPKLASEQVFAAVKRFPNDLLLNLAVVDVLLRRPDADALKRAEEPLTHAQALFEKMSDEEKETNRANMDLTHGVYLALSGKVTEAKEALKSVLSEDEDNEEAKALIAILSSAH